MADRVEDVLVPPAMRGECLMGMGMIGVGAGLIVVIRPSRPNELRLWQRHPQPPAIAGSSRTSSRSATGVSRPFR